MDPDLIQRVVDFTISLQQIPAPTFHEERRAEFIRQSFLAEGLRDVSIDAIGNVFACLPGKEAAPGLVLSAHCDTVFPLSTELKVRREGDQIFGPGIGDNSLGVAGLFGVLWGLRHRQVTLPGDLWLVANVCEEGLGDLRGMRAVVDHFGDQVLGYVILEGMALGQIYNRGLGVRRYRITVKTPGGHSWVDFGRPSAVHELARLMERVLAIELPERPRTSLNIGVISGGTTVNTIAAQAHMDLDLRSEGRRPLARLADQVESLVKEANRPEVRVTAELIGSRPAGKISASHPLVRLAQHCLEAQGIQPRLGIGSTDANIPFSRELPAICIGLSTGGGAHTLDEFIQVGPLYKGLSQVLALVEGAHAALTER